MKRYVDRVGDGLLVALMALAVGNVTWQVVSRFALSAPSAYTDELSRFVLVWIGLIGAARGVGERAHLAMNVLVLRLSARRREWIGVAVDALLFAFACIVLVYGGGSLVVLSLELGQRSAAMRVPLGCVYAALPLAGLMMCFYAAGFLRERFARLRDGGTARLR